MEKINGILSFRTSSRTAIIPEPQGNHLAAVFIIQKNNKKKNFRLRTGSRLPSLQCNFRKNGFVNKANFKGAV